MKSSRNKTITVTAEELKNFDFLAFPKKIKDISELKNKILLTDSFKSIKLIPDNAIDLILTDLPYGVTARNKWDVIIPFDKLWEQWNRIKKETTPIILTSIQPFTSLCVLSKPEFFKYEWIWEKQQGTGFLNAKKQPLRNHESVLVFYEKQPVYNPQMTKGKPYTCKSGKGSLNYGEQKQIITENKGERYPLTVRKFAYDGKKEHPTQKPISLFEYLIKTYSNEHDTILDCCAGSGTTGVACKNTNRNYICIEKEEKYYNIMKDRIEQENTLQTKVKQQNSLTTFITKYFQSSLSYACTKNTREIHQES